jgi:type I restriction enzyme S subunit
VTTDDFVGYLANHATGSAYPAVSFKDFEEACLLVPSVRLLDAFHTLTGDMLNGINVLQRQNGVLGQMRDLLIPKLIAGEVDMESLDGVCARRNGQAIPPDSGGLR